MPPGKPLGFPSQRGKSIAESRRPFREGRGQGLTRRNKAREPAGGWYATQALTAEETVRAYTNWAAFAAFSEDDTGIIEAGRWADLTVMDIDPFSLESEDPGRILDGEIVATIVGGRVVYRR